ncbi:MAG: CocE/NonD family hydrolase, partial [Bacteroidales bacterium]
DMMVHPNYDEWWQERNYLRYCKDLRIPTLIVGGFYDAEDAYGAFSLYKYLAGNASGSQVHLTAGPWSHGQWRKKNADRLGNLSFGENTAIWFQDSIEIPFFEYYLRDRGDIRNLHKVAVHLSGSNRKINPGQWPPKDLKEVTYYLHPGGNLKKEAVKTETNTTYISDPHHPVPYTDRIASRRVAEYMTADQRFAASRSDVITYRSEPLSQEVTVLGPVEISLRAAISTTDADFVVKIIDEYPDPSGPNNELSGYQLLIRGEVMRGRYRKGLSNPIPFTPGRAEDICWQTVDIGHTFQKGHRIVVQIQSSWFPLIDRNPQQFVNIYQCGISDFIPSQIQITEGGTYGSSIKFSCLP